MFSINKVNFLPRCKINVNNCIKMNNNNFVHTHDMYDLILYLCDEKIR